MKRREWNWIKKKKLLGEKLNGTKWNQRIKINLTWVSFFFPLDVNLSPNIKKIIQITKVTIFCDRLNWCLAVLLIHQAHSCRILNTWPQTMSFRRIYNEIQRRTYITSSFIYIHSYILYIYIFLGLHQYNFSNIQFIKKTFYVLLLQRLLVQLLLYTCSRQMLSVEALFAKIIPI